MRSHFCLSSNRKHHKDQTPKVSQAHLRTSDPYELKQLENRFQFLRMDLEFQKGKHILKWKWRERRRELEYEEQFQSLELERMME